MPTSDKLDLFKQLKAEYVQPRKPAFVVTTPAQYLCVEGEGPPGAAAFEQGIAALYPVAFTTKFRRKLGPGPDYATGKLECRWLAVPETRDARNGWHWQLLMRVPDFIQAAEVDAAIDALIAKQKPAFVRDVKLLRLDERRCVQLLHIGPYDEEPASFNRMIEYAGEQGCSVNGAAHEIYLSDPRRVEPASLKTILRLPVT